MIDIIRHIEVFDPESFGDRRIDVIGAGATGSRIVLSLAKLGLKNIHVWDFDEVEPHNIPNQAFGIEDIGSPKVEAIKKIVKTQTGTSIFTHQERVDGTQTLGEVVFVLTDTMSSRQEIWKAGIRYKSRTKLMIETRIGKNSGRVYSVNPSRPNHVRGWEETLYGDEVAEVSACGASITVGPTAEFVSALAVWQLIRWSQIETELSNGKTISDELRTRYSSHYNQLWLLPRTFKERNKKMTKLAVVKNEITVKIGAFPGGKVTSYQFAAGTSIEDGLKHADIGGRDKTGLDVRVNGKPTSSLTAPMEDGDQVLVFSKVRGNL